MADLKIRGKNYKLRYHYKNKQGKLMAVLYATDLLGEYGDEWPVNEAGVPQPEPEGGT